MSELYTTFPFVIAVDVSLSMKGAPIEAAGQLMPALRDVFTSDPTVGTIARIAVVTFSDEGRIVVPLCDIEGADMPHLKVERGTNFAAAFRTIKAAIEEGMCSFPRGTPVYRPVVFFLSDGAHEVPSNSPDLDYVPALQDLVKGWKFAPEIVAFGIGDQVDEKALGQIATRHAFLAKDRDPVAAVRDIGSAILNSILLTSKSSMDPDKQTGLYITNDSDFTELPIFEI
jgi:uncharacterized protein YegL